MSPRRWFWLLMAGGVLWSWAGWKWDADPHTPHVMRRTQGLIAGVPEVLLIPGEFVFRLGEEATTGVVRKIAFTPQSSGASQELAATLRNLQNENAQLKGMLLEAYSRIEALQHLQMIGIRPEDSVVANILALGPGQGQGRLSIDKGAQSGIQINNAVVAPLAQVALLGRIVATRGMQSDVQLLTDAASKVQAQIIRPRVTPAGARGVVADQIIVRQCLVEGMGNNLMRSTDVNVQQGIGPETGDLVQITDPGWPAKTQYMVFGQIEKVAHREDQPLRYELTIIPRVSATTQRNVVVLIKD